MPYFTSLFDIVDFITFNISIGFFFILSFLLVVVAVIKHQQCKNMSKYLNCNELNTCI